MNTGQKVRIVTTQPLSDHQNVYLGYTGTVTYVRNHAANVQLDGAGEFSFRFAQLEPQ